MKRTTHGEPPPRGARYRHDKMPRVMIICQDAVIGNLLRSELRRLLRAMWFVSYETIYDYHASIDCNLIHDLIVYCPLSHERMDVTKEAIGKMLFYCREARVILYCDGRCCLDDHRVAETVAKPDIDGLAAAINRLLQPEAA